MRKVQVVDYGLPREPLRHNNLLVPNVNTWGNVIYNIPLRHSYNETRTGTSIGHRFIPPIPHSLDCKIQDPLPGRVTGRDMVVEHETFRTTSGEYSIKPNPNKAMERADCGINCKRVLYMTGIEKELQKATLVKPHLMTEMKDNFRGLRKSLMAPPDIIVKPPDPEYIFDVVAAERNNAPCIPEDTTRGYRRLMDPYYTTYRKCHRPFSADDQYSVVGAKDQITFYSEFNTPRVRGFGPRYKEIWMPLTAKPFQPIYDKLQVRKPYIEVAAAHNAVNNLIGIFESESKRKYKAPYTVSSLVTWNNEEIFNLPPFPPNPYQTNIAPFMYCSDYCHINQGNRPNTVVDSFARKLPAHKQCAERYIVSKD